MAPESTPFEVEPVFTVSWWTLSVNCAVLLEVSLTAIWRFTRGKVIPSSVKGRFREISIRMLANATSLYFQTDLQHWDLSNRRKAFLLSEVQFAETQTDLPTSNFQLWDTPTTFVVCALQTWKANEWSWIIELVSKCCHHLSVRWMMCSVFLHSMV